MSVFVASFVYAIATLTEIVNSTPDRQQRRVLFGQAAMLERATEGSTRRRPTERTAAAWTSTICSGTRARDDQIQRWRRAAAIIRSG
jgi:hypothetical protein